MSKHALYMVDNDFPWRIVYDNVQQILAEHSSRAALSDFLSLLGTEWLEDSVIAALIDCMKRGIPMPDSAADRTICSSQPQRILQAWASLHVGSILCTQPIHLELQKI
jgi:hypothetical protein